MYQVRVGEKLFEVNENEGVFEINGEKVEPKIIKTSDTRYEVVMPDRVITVNKLNESGSSEWLLEVNGQKMDVSLKDEYALLLEKMGLDKMMAAKAGDLKAPMPGLVLDLLVEPGSDVTKGDGLVILEAMKMENIIKSPADGTIKSISVDKGQAVEKNQVLISFE